MIELLSMFSLSDIIIMLIMVAVAAKECLSLFGYFWGKIKSIFNKGYEIKDEKEELLERLDELTDYIKMNKEEHKDFSKTVSNIQKEYRTMFETQQKTLNKLIASDIEDIKSDIVKQYHHFTTKEWIDDFSMDAVERRFARYEEEGGNSYVHTLVERLRQLPNEPIEKE